MFVDNSLCFNGSWTTPQAITVTADSSTVLDVTGVGSGNAPAMIGGYPATNTAIGMDWGSGIDGIASPTLYLVVTTAGTTSNTLTIALKAAPDNGSYGQGSYTTLYTSAAFTGSTLTKGSTLVVPVPPTLSAWSSSPEALPRFYKLTYTCSGSLTVSVSAGILLNAQNALVSTLIPNNYIAV